MFLVARAGAQEQLPIALDYTAPAACPSAEQFLAEVAARTSVARPAKPNESAKTLTVSIQEVAGGNRGTLRLDSPDGASSARQVAAADCEQVVSALALMTALAVDPDASTAPMPPASAPVVKPPVVKPPVVKLPPVTPRAEKQAPPLVQHPTSTKWRTRVGVALEALGGVAPDPLLVVRPLIEIDRESAAASSALRLTAGWGRETVGSAEFTLLDARVEGCPFRLRPSRRLRISPCLALDVGRLEAAGVSVTPAETVDRPWVAAGAVARLEWQIVNALVVEVGGELFVPLERDRFFVDQDTTLHRTPFVAGGAEAAVSASFP
jgi:hypothetical protein